MNKLELCHCNGVVSKQLLVASDNMCPSCKKPLTGEINYRTIVGNSFDGTTIDGGRNDESERRPGIESLGDTGGHVDSADDVVKALGLLSGATFGLKTPGRRPDLRLDIPRFSGCKGHNPRHFFARLRAYLDSSGIRGFRNRIQILTHSFEGQALDLFLSLSEDQRGDLGELERVFTNHFAPRQHYFRGLSDFLKLRKKEEETVSEFLLRLRMHAEDHGISKDILLAVFLLGLPTSFQRHLALQGVTSASLEELVEESLKFERVAGFEKREDGLQSNVVSVGEFGRLEAKFDRVLSTLNSWESGEEEEKVIDGVGRGDDGRTPQLKQRSVFLSREHTGGGAGIVAGWGNGQSGEFDRGGTGVGTFRGIDTRFCKDRSSVTSSQGAYQTRVYHVNDFHGRGTKVGELHGTTGSRGHKVDQYGLGGPKRGQGLKAVGRTQDFWVSAHRRIMEEIGTMSPKVLLIGDSLVKQIARTSVVREEGWKKARIVNGGICGDRIENVLYRLRNIRIPSSVTHVYLAVGTNNLFRNSCDEIVATIRCCVREIEARNADIKVHVQSILPRRLRGVALRKLRVVNSNLRDVFQDKFVDAGQIMFDCDGRFRKSLLWRDGMNLRTTGSNILARFIYKVLASDSSEGDTLGHRELSARSNVSLTCPVKDVCTKFPVMAQQLSNAGKELDGNSMFAGERLCYGNDEGSVDKRSIFQGETDFPKVSRRAGIAWSGFVRAGSKKFWKSGGHIGFVGARNE